MVEEDDWSITFADTGLKTLTGGRIKRIERYIDEDNFFATYADGLSTVDLKGLAAFHSKRGKTATLTGVNPLSPFGIVEERNGLAASFKEKPRLPGLINGGFFVFNKRIFDYLDEDSALEEEPLRRLTKEGELAIFKHDGFWSCMDTFKDVDRLNKMWDAGERPWVVWKG